MNSPTETDEYCISLRCRSKGKGQTLETEQKDGSQELGWATWVILVQETNFLCEPVVLGSPGFPCGLLGSMSCLLTHHPQPHLQSQGLHHHLTRISGLICIFKMHTLYIYVLALKLNRYIYALFCRIL